MSSLSADMRSKRPQDFNPPACSQKRIRVTPDRGHIPSPHDNLENVQPRLHEDAISWPSSETEALLGGSQDVNMSFQALPFADHSPMDMGEIVGRGASIQEICYGAVSQLIRPEALILSI